METDPFSVLDLFGGAFHTHHGWRAVLPGDHGTVGHHAADLGHQPCDRSEEWGPAGVCLGGDDDVAGFEVGVGDVRDDAGAAFDGSGGHCESEQCAGGKIAAPVGAGYGFAIGGENSGWRERPVGTEIMLALLDELLVDVMGAHDFVEFLETEIENVFPVVQHSVGDETVGLGHQCLFVDGVAADHGVLRIFPVADEGPDTVDLFLGLCSFLMSVGQSQQAFEHFALFRSRIAAALREASLRLARLHVRDVSEDERQERRWLFVPSRSGDVDLAARRMPSHTDGFGSVNHGTLDELRTAFPNARVLAFGFSLGDGVHGDGTLNSIDFNGTTYAFARTVILNGKDACKKGGWATRTNPVFTNQSNCVSYFATRT